MNSWIIVGFVFFAIWGVIVTFVVVNLLFASQKLTIQRIEYEAWVNQLFMGYAERIKKLEENY